MRIVHTSLLAAFLATTLGFAVSARAETIDFRVSVDTSPTHIRTIQIGRYLDAIKAKSQGRLNPTLFHSSQLFADRDVGKALRQGGIEMAAPGTWVLTGFEPNLDIFSLPMFFGVKEDGVHLVSDGAVGQIL